MGWPQLNIRAFIVAIVVPTLAFVIVAMTVVLLAGLFNKDVDNSEIFKIIAPAFQMIIGVFGGFLGGYAVGRGAKPDEKDEA